MSIATPENPTEEYVALTPRFMAADETEAVGQWLRALPDGWEPVGDPEVHVADLPAGDLALYGGIQPWRIVGRMRYAKPPKFAEPNEEAVTAAAQAIASRLHPDLGEWVDLPAHVRNYYMVTALEGLKASLPLMPVTVD